MPKRNLLLVCLMPVICLVAWAARDRGAHGRRFGEVLTAIDRSYIEPVDEARLFHRAMDGVFAGLDEHSAYVTDRELDELDATLNQSFGGVGLQLSSDPRDGSIVVDEPVVASPAWRAGIQTGERITAVDGAAVQGRALRDVVALLRGRPDTPVTVELARASDDPEVITADDGRPLGSRTVVLTRELVRTESVLGDRRRDDGGWEWRLEGDEHVALVRIVSFGERTVAELDAALDAITAGSPPVAGLIVDLRGNPGGLLTAAVDVCDRFLDRGVIVSTRGRRPPQLGTGGAPVGPPGSERGSLEVRRATAGAVFADLPVAVLIDGLTASAGEIVAACLQDNGRSVTVGSRSFGKGTVQSLLPLADGRSLLKLTTSEYVRPSGEPIHRRPHHTDADRWGVSPDPAGSLTPMGESLERLLAWRRARDRAPRTDRGAVRSADDSSDPAAALPRHADPVLGRALVLLGAGAGDGETDGGSAPGFDADLTAPLVADPVR
jgi:carboxyl-terminal processing protease